MPVQGGSGPLCDVPQRHPGVETGDERVTKGVRADGFGDPGPACHPAHNSPGAVTVQPLAVTAEEERSFAAFPDGQVDRSGGAGREPDGDLLAALADDAEGPVPALKAECLDISAGGLGDAQPVEGQQGDQRVLGRWPVPGGDQ